MALGTTARADCMAQAIKRSAHSELYTFMVKKNPSVARLSKEFVLGELSDFGKLKSFAERVNPDLAVISPDDALALGAHRGGRHPVSETAPHPAAVPKGGDPGRSGNLEDRRRGRVVAQR